MNFAEDNSPLTDEFDNACNAPHDYDCGFVEQRRDTGFANFGYDPAKAAEMREKELARIADELEDEELDYEDGDDTDFDYLDEEDEDEYDRFEESYGFDDEDEEDNWE